MRTPRLLLFAVFAVLLVAPRPVLAQSPPDLFTVVREALPAPSPGALSVRSAQRWVVQPNAPWETTIGSGRVTLPLGDNGRVVAAFHRVEAGPGAGAGFAGVVEGVDEAHATFLVRNGSLAGAIYLPDATYLLSPAPGGAHVLERMPGGVPACAGAMVPPLASRSPGSAAAVAELEAPAAGADLGTIDLLVVYTPDALAAAGSADALRTSVDLAVLETNTALTNSHVPARVRLVHMAAVAYEESRNMGVDLNRIAGKTDGVLDEVHELRDQVGADLVTLVTEHNTTAAAGQAFLLSGFQGDYSGYGFSVVMRPYLGGFVLAHELGHNLGLNHDRANAGTGYALLAYAYGYQDPPHLRDIMAYACAGVRCPSIPHFSNPRVTWQGRPTGREDTEDNARALMLTVPVVRRFRVAALPAVTSIEPATGPTLGGARITMRGTGLADVTQVRFGGRSAPIESTSADAVIVRAPSHVGATVDVVVTDQEGRSVTLASAFQFLATTADTDADALSDEWERLFGLDPNAATGDDGPSGDPDRDGLDNEREFELGRHPRGAHRRFFAEGATGALFDTRFSLANPSDAAVTAALSFTLGDGTTRAATVAIPAMSRRTVRAAEIPGLETAEFSTVIETREPIAADRLMEWDPRERFGSHMETAVGRPRSVWFLAEGATHSGFALFYLLQNPLDRPVTVDVTFLLPAPAAPVVQEHQLAPNSRYNIWVNQIPALSSTDVSAVLRARDGAEIIVERSMYLASQGKAFGAGHSSAAITEPVPRWYFAEGATGAYFDTFLLIANPGEQPVTVEATYLLPSGTSIHRSHVVGPLSRYNIWVDQEAPELADTAVSVVLETSNGEGIIAERAMWWPGSSPTWGEAHVAAGATTTANRWVSSEGQQDASHETYLLIANPSASAASARVTMMFEDGPPVARVVPLPAGSRTNVAVGADFPEAFGKRFSTLVEVLEPGVEVVVERAVYADSGSQRWAAGASALATPARTSLTTAPGSVDDGLLRVSGSAPWNAVRVEVDGAPTEIDDGAFAIGGVPLLEGDNVVPVRAYSADGVLISESAVHVAWQPVVAAAGEITPSAGGTVRVVDATSRVAGVIVEVPAGASERTFRLRVDEQRELLDTVPHAGWRAVGAAVSIAPIGEEFRGDVRIVLPVPPAALPAGVGMDAVVAYANRDEGWVAIPIESRDAASVTVRVRDFGFSGVRLLVPEPVRPGELLITSDPGGASIAVGGIDTGMSTPARLGNQAPGLRSLRLYAPGYNEMRVDVDVASSGTRVHVSATRPAATAPQVQLTATGDRIDVTDALYQLRGTVTRLGAPYPNSRTYVMVNGREESAGVGADGKFSHVVTLEPGLNTIRVRSTDMDNQTGVSRQLQVFLALTGAVMPDIALMPAKRPEMPKVAALPALAAAAGGGPPVYVELSWDTDGTDVDLHVYDPDGRRAWYADLRGIPGGALRYDDVDGFGPEVFELPSARAGACRVVVVYYSSSGRGATTARVTIRVGTQAVFNGTQSLAGTGSQWAAHTFTVADGMSILSATTPGGRDRLGHVFTTLAGENLLRLRVAAPDGIADSDIRYEVREINEGHVVDTSRVSGRDVVIPLTHAPLTGLISPRRGPRLAYDVVVTAPGGLRATTRIQQDTRSQIRQEYVDKRDFRRAFRWAPPDRSSLIDAAGMPAMASPFGFGDFVAHSDYRDDGIAMVGRSAPIAESVARLYGKPLRISSGWRNPRRNDAVGGTVDSYHQTGDAVDVNPLRSKAHWPAATYEASQITLWRRAQQLNADGRRYDVILHGSGTNRHLHVEPR
jgi:uncharacterized protein YfaP (DUF2135 family)